MLRLDGKVAFVSGAGSVGDGWGNGKATATVLARQGARVYGTDIRDEAAAETRGTPPAGVSIDARSDPGPVMASR